MIEQAFGIVMKGGGLGVAAVISFLYSALLCWLFQATLGGFSFAARWCRSFAEPFAPGRAYSGTVCKNELND